MLITESRRVLTLLLGAVLVFTLFDGDEAHAQKSKPPGGTTTPPPGLIYFRHDNAMWQMDAAGTPATRVPLPNAPSYGDPSFQRYNGRRWFSYEDSVIENNDLAQFPTGRSVLNVWAGDDAGSRVLLLDDPAIEVLTPTLWARDDSAISFVGERWALDELGDPVEVVEAGLYTLAISFVGGSPVAGELELAADLSGPMRLTPAGFLLGNDSNGIAGHSWNATRSWCSFGVRMDLPSGRVQEIWGVDLAQITDPGAPPASAFTLLASGNGIGWPDWSPDGKKLGYVSWDGTVVLDIATGRKKTLTDSATAGWGRTIWSPASTHFVTYRWDNSYGYDGIFRFKSDLTGKTELTAGLCGNTQAFRCVLIPVGWRN